MIKNILFLIFIMTYCLGVSAQVRSCKCTTSKPIENQHRGEAKHETDYGKFKVKHDTINVKYIYGWQKMYENITKTITLKSSKITSKRRENTPEDTLYVLKGYMWFVKLEDDCDFHIEIGTAKASDTRIIVEVSQENESLQNKIRNELDKRNLYILHCTTSEEKKAHFSEGIPVVVTGLGFYDASHQPDTDHGDSHTKKYSWELHPVKDIVFLKK